MKLAMQQDADSVLPLLSSSIRDTCMTKAPDLRKLSLRQREALVLSALGRARDIAKTLAQGEAVLRVYTEVLRFVVDSEYLGACHDTSAVLHMVLAEHGVTSELCIGEVGIGRHFFDHSWVDIDGAIFDVAVCMPDPRGAHVGGPVFHSTDLFLARPTDMVYGAESGMGLGGEALPALTLDLAGYSAVQPQPDIWTLAVAIASRSGLTNPTFAQFRARYGKARRTVRTVRPGGTGLS